MASGHAVDLFAEEVEQPGEGYIKDGLGRVIGAVGQHLFKILAGNFPELEIGVVYSVEHFQQAIDGLAARDGGEGDYARL
jgi:hypothetical protein